MPRTAAQAEASRRNGARSRGPRTPEGRRRSAQNARTHGLRAASFQLAPAEAQRFARLEAEIGQRFRPCDPLQHDACRRLAVAFWRSQQLDRLEARIWPDVQAGDHRPLATLLRYRPGVERALLRALADLRAMRAASASGNNTNEPEQPGRHGREPRRSESLSRPGGSIGCESSGTNEPEAGRIGTNEPGITRNRTNEPGRPVRQGMEAPRRTSPSGQASSGDRTASCTNEPGGGPPPAADGSARPPLPAGLVAARPDSPNEPGKPNRRQRRRLAALRRQRPAR